MGADEVVIAPISRPKFVVSKYTGWVRKGFRGTALDWIVNTGRSAELEDSFVHSLQGLSVALIHVNHVFTLGFARILQHQLSRHQKIPLVLETHDVQSNLMHERQDLNPWTHKLDSSEELLRSEIASLKEPDVLVHCSVEDFDFFSKELPGKEHVLVLPTIDDSFINSVRAGDAQHKDPFDLLFVGQRTDVNFAAVRWFLEEVWAKIAHHSLRLRIVGAVQSLVQERTPELYQRFERSFVGPVDDLVGCYRNARCVIAPMVFGTGISMKTVEALGSAKPFVGTSKAFRGMPGAAIRRAGMKIHETPQEFADAILWALSNENEGASVSRQLYDTLFSKRASFVSREAVLKSAQQIKTLGARAGI